MQGGCEPMAQVSIARTEAQIEQAAALQAHLGR